MHAEPMPGSLSCASFVQNTIKTQEGTITGLMGQLMGVQGQLMGVQGQLTGTQGQLAVAHNTIAAKDVETAKRVLMTGVGAIITTCATTYFSTLFVTEAGERDMVKTTFAWAVSTPVEDKTGGAQGRLVRIRGMTTLHNDGWMYCIDV